VLLLLLLHLDEILPFCLNACCTPSSSAARLLLLLLLLLPPPPPLLLLLLLPPLLLLLPLLEHARVARAAVMSLAIVCTQPSHNPLPIGAAPWQQKVLQTSAAPLCLLRLCARQR
jgi:hypothetical protein